MSKSELTKCDAFPSALTNSFQTDGFVGPLSILTCEEAQEAYQEYLEWKNSLPSQSLSGNARFKPHLYLPFVNRIVHHPKLVSVVKQALATDNILLWSSDFNIKEPYSEGCYAPHQDSTYAGLSPASKSLTAWIALSDPVGTAQGCLCFWKHSHTQGQLPHIENFLDKTNMLSRGQRLVESLNDSEKVTIPLRGGEATLHNFCTVHASGPNQSNQPRVGLALRYIDACVKQMGKTRETVTLISGSLQHDEFDLEPILPHDPAETDIEIGRKAHAEAMRREAANYFDGSNASTYDESKVS